MPGWLTFVRFSSENMDQVLLFVTIMATGLERLQHNGQRSSRLENQRRTRTPETYQPYGARVRGFILKSSSSLSCSCVQIMLCFQYRSLGGFPNIELDPNLNLSATRSLRLLATHYHLGHHHCTTIMITNHVTHYVALRPQSVPDMLSQVISSKLFKRNTSYQLNSSNIPKLFSFR